MSAQTLLLDWLKARLAPESVAWLEEKAALLATGAQEKTVSLSFSACVRYSGKAPLGLPPADLQAASATSAVWYRRSIIRAESGPGGKVVSRKMRAA